MRTLALRLAAFLVLSSALCLAGSWSGVLVDSKCFAGEERNVGPTDTLTNVDRDRNLEIDFCSPRTKTKSFAVVERNGLSFYLDSAGNAQAVELVRKAGKKTVFPVVVTGEQSKNVVKVDSISMAKSASPQH